MPVDNIFKRMGGVISTNIAQLKTELQQENVTIIDNITTVNQRVDGVQQSLTTATTKLSGIEDSANYYVLPTANSSVFGGVKINNDSVHIDAGGFLFIDKTWSTISNKPTTISGFGITDAISTSGGTIDGGLVIGQIGYLQKSSPDGVARIMVQDGTGRQHWYWNTAGGVSPLFSSSEETASDVMHSQGSFIFRASAGAGKSSGDSIIWSNVLEATLDGTFKYKSNNVWHSGNLTDLSQLTNGPGYLTTAASINGNIATNFNVNNLVVGGSILPSNTSTLDIGSPSFRFRTIYVDEARLSTNTLYIGDTPILGTDQDTINIKADPDQSINMKTQGTGTTLVTSAKGVSVETTGMNADVVVQASGTGSRVRIGATTSVDVSAPLNINSTMNVTGSTTVAALTVNGNLTVNGTNSIVNSTTVTTGDNIIVLNSGEVGAGVTAGKSGIQVDRGEEADYQILFDETDDLFKVGMVGNLETIASRPWVTTNFSALSHTHPSATQSSSGFMTGADKTKLDAITGTNTGDQVIPTTLPASDVYAWAKATVKPTYTSNEVGLGNVNDTSDANKPVSTAQATAIGLKLDATHAGTGGTAHAAVTTLVDGFMSAADKIKLNGIETGANAYSLPVATITTLGGVKDGNGVTIAGDGAITINYGSAVNTAVQGNDVRVTADQSEATASIRTIGTGALQAAAGNHTHSNVVAAGAAGFMTGADKTKLDAITGSNTGDQTTITGNAGSATVLQTARTIAGVSFNGSANIAVPYANLTGLPTLGTAAAKNVPATGNASATEVVYGTDTRLTDSRVANGGNAATVTTNANLTGVVTSVGNATSIAAGAITNTMLANGAVANLSGTNTGDQTTITGNAGSATVLQTARTINGVSFNGSANITINAVDSTARIASTEKGAVNGVATLDASGLVTTSQLPSYVDDVLEYANLAGFPATGATGKIYVALDTNKTYRWSGSAYVYITSGAVDSVAGKTGVVLLVKADVGLGSVDNTADSAKPVSTAQATAIGLKLDATHAGTGGAAHANVVAAGASGFMTGADKTKLDGIAAGATAYTHPANHPASIITQDASNRFVTDTEKTTWNAKQPAITRSLSLDYNSGGTYLDHKASGVTVWWVGRGAQSGGSDYEWYDALAGVKRMWLSSNSTSGLHIQGSLDVQNGNVVATGTISGSNLSGTNTGNQTIAGLSGSPTATQLRGALGTGTTDYTTFLRGDGTWQSLYGGGGLVQSAGSTNGGAVEYSGTGAANGKFNGGTTIPTSTTRLNYEGYLYATAFYGNANLKTYTEAKPAVTYAATTNIDLSTGTCFDVTLTGNVTFTFSNCPNVANTMFSFTLIVRQDATGSRTAVFPTNRPQGGTALTLTTTANKADILSFMTPDGGTTWFSNIAKNY